MRNFILIILCFSLITATAFTQNTDIDPNAKFEPVFTDDFMDKVFGPIDLETITGDNQLLGCETDGDDFFWVTGGNAGVDPNKLYKFSESDSTWTLEAAYDQPQHCTGWGWRDLVYCDDDRYLYASCGPGIDQIDPHTGYWTGYTIGFGPMNPCRALAWDPATDHFWLANFTSNIYEIDRYGTVINSFSNSYSIYGLAWDPVCGNDPRLFVHSQDGNGMLVLEFDPIAGQYTGNQWDVTENSGVAGGAAGIYYPWEGAIFYILLVLGQGTPDFISGYELCVDGMVPDTNLSATLEILSPTVPSVNGDILFAVSVRNRSIFTVPIWAEIYPTIGDCISGSVMEMYDLKMQLVDYLPSGERISGNYFYHVNNVSGMNLSLCALTMDVGAGPDIYIPEARVCDEFLFYNPWGRSGGEIIWGDDWYRLDENVPATTSLSQNYPNPFNATTTISFDLASDANVSLKIYNLNGQLIEVLVDSRMNAGRHNVNWDASALSSGVYFYKLSIGDRVFSRRMTLLK
jgi:hypothetical protein